MKVACGAVRVGGQKQGVIAAIDIGHIHAAVGANEPVVRLGDEYAILAPDDRTAFAQGKLDDPGVETILLRPCAGFGRRLDRREVDDAALGLRNNFVFDDENIAGLECEAALPQRL